MVSILVLGFMMGMRHALDADHVAAVAALSTRSESWRANAVRGSAWGLGHMLMLSAVGGLCLLFETAVSEQWARRLELAAGVMLLVLGGDLLWRLVRRRIHVHAHRHDDGTVHLHAHGHSPEERHDPQRHEHEHPEGFPLRALAIGGVHGLAGSAALLLVALHQIGSFWRGLAYIGIFGLGSILGMTLLSVVIAIPLRASARWLTGVHQGVELTIALATLGVGWWVLSGLWAG
ncbi:MAG TPA: hypothetical protein VEK15_04870 [Vicinamibacteria bacterium]|nr:hypothetical protein [Vicinamibacteria bacterium]